MNIILVFLGWSIWNFALFTIEKDRFDDEDKPFPVGKYIRSHWDNWLLSAIMIPVLIIVGIKGLDLTALPFGDFQDFKWGDLYYLGAGAFSEMVKHYVVVIIKKYSVQGVNIKVKADESIKAEITVEKKDTSGQEPVPNPPTP